MHSYIDGTLDASHLPPIDPNHHTIQAIQRTISKSYNNKNRSIEELIAYSSSVMSDHLKYNGGRIAVNDTSSNDFSNNSSTSDTAYIGEFKRNDKNSNISHLINNSPSVQQGLLVIHE